MKGGTEPPGATGEHQELLLATGRTADAGKSTARVTTVVTTFGHFLDDRPEEAVVLFKVALILSQKLIEVVEQYLVERIFSYSFKLLKKNNIVSTIS